MLKESMRLVRSTLAGCMTKTLLIFADFIVIPRAGRPV